MKTIAIADRSDALWVVCLCAEWCGACREYRPLFESVARAHPALRFAWVDVEDHAENRMLKAYIRDWPAEDESS